MDSHTQRAAANKPANVPMHVVSFGEDIPLATKLLKNIAQTIALSGLLGMMI